MRENKDEVKFSGNQKCFQFFSPGLCWSRHRENVFINAQAWSCIIKSIFARRKLMMKIQLRIGNYAVLEHRLHSPTKRSNCFNLTWNHSSRIDTNFFNSICFSFTLESLSHLIHPRMYALRSFRVLQPSPFSTWLWISMKSRTILSLLWK